MIQNLSYKYNQKFLDHGKQSATNVLETVPKRSIQKIAEAADDLINNTIDDKVAKNSWKLNWKHWAGYIIYIYIYIYNWIMLKTQPSFKYSESFM